MPLEKYVDKLPVPKALRATKRTMDSAYYEIDMREIKQKLHRDLSETTLWGYNGSYPGPLIETRVGEKVRVKWINKLPEKHLLPVDKTVHGAEPPAPEVRTVVHLHGGRIKPEDDGYPEAWFTKDFEETGPKFVKETLHYPNLQRPASLWYHDHALGITRLNVYAGLAGLYFIRSSSEECLCLPKGKYEIPLVVQDRSFNPDGSLCYPYCPSSTGGPNCPNSPEECPEDIPYPSVVPEFFGDTILVNGKVWPYLEVEPRRYRFRIYNGSNSRFYRISLSSGQPFSVIGNDQGFLERTAVTEVIILGPGERVDTILDFSGFNGESIIMTNDAGTPFPMGEAPDPDTTGQIMEFRVNLTLAGSDTSKIPQKPGSVDQLPEKLSERTRDLTLVESEDEYGRLMPLLNNMMWEDPITEKPQLGSVEIWRLVNLTPDTHPIHLHLVEFKILDRQPFDVEHYNNTGEIVFTGPAVKPDNYESGWKDTVRANPGEITRIIMKFAPFAGLYVWHCHILEHEDYEMMRPYEVVPKKKRC